MHATQTLQPAKTRIGLTIHSTIIIASVIQFFYKIIEALNNLKLRIISEQCKTQTSSRYKNLHPSYNTTSKYTLTLSVQNINFDVVKYQGRLEYVT